VYAAIFLVTEGSVEGWALTWLGWELVGKVVVGAAFGVAVGWLLAKLAFRSRAPSLRLAEQGEPLLALAGVLLSYGAAESLGGGYGFLAVFACAMTLRSAERGHDYHAHMHESIERLERLLTLVVLLLLGVTLTSNLLGDVTLRSVLIAAALIFVVRPLSAVFALRVGSGKDRVGDRTLGPASSWPRPSSGSAGSGRSTTSPTPRGKRSSPDSRSCGPQSRSPSHSRSWSMEWPPPRSWAASRTIAAR
jgi:NhaP-type Na+/H+ or K+/H+ antiporter